MYINKKDFYEYQNEYQALPDSRRQKNYFIRIILIGGLLIASFLLFLIVFNRFSLLYFLTREEKIQVLYAPAPPESVLTAPASNDKLTVEFSHGQIKGSFRTSREGRQYYSFLGIPYAKNPTGDLRFADPVSPDKWEGVRDGTIHQEECIQNDDGKAAGKEDCLYLNLYTPKMPTGTELLDLPVMVYIHGGGFSSGNATKYSPKYFMDEDVVLITFEYRVGALGFLDTEDGVIPANLGLRDQVFLLKWVQQNVANFGGGPNRVSIFGNSGGGFFVSALVLSPMAKGLFHRAISQSGVILPPQYQNRNPKQDVINIGNYFNCKTNDSQKLVECLRKQSAKNITEIDVGSHLHPNYCLTIEKYNTSGQVFMPDTPINLLTSNQVNRVSWMLGINELETLGSALEIVGIPEEEKKYNEEWATNGPDILGFDKTASNPEELANKTRQFYLGDKNFGNDTLYNITYMISDAQFNYHTRVAGLLHSNHSEVFLYFLRKPVPLSYAAKHNPNNIDVSQFPPSHADELQFLFLYSGYPEITPDSEYFNFSRNMVKMWASFAATGSPSENWLPIDPKDNAMKWWQLDDEQKLIEPFTERMEFWDGLKYENLYYTN